MSYFAFVVGPDVPLVLLFGIVPGFLAQLFFLVGSDRILMSLTVYNTFQMSCVTDSSLRIKLKFLIAVVDAAESLSSATVLTSGLPKPALLVQGELGPANPCIRQLGPLPQMHIQAFPGGLLQRQ